MITVWETHQVWGRGPVFLGEAPEWCNPPSAPPHAVKPPQPDGSWSAGRSHPSLSTWISGWTGTAKNFCHRSRPHRTLKTEVKPLELRRKLKYSANTPHLVNGYKHEHSQWPQPSLSPIALYERTMTAQVSALLVGAEIHEFMDFQFAAERCSDTCKAAHPFLCDKRTICICTPASQWLTNCDGQFYT